MTTMIKSGLVVLFVTGITTFASSGVAYALNTETHRVINEAVANQAGLDSFLKTQLGLPGGINEVFRTQPVSFWIGEGGVREDDGFRFFNHFHDPLQPWSTAGLGLG